MSASNATRKVPPDFGCSAEPPDDPLQTATRAVRATHHRRRCTMQTLLSTPECPTSPCQHAYLQASTPGTAHLRRFSRPVTGALLHRSVTVPSECPTSCFQAFRGRPHGLSIQVVSKRILKPCKDSYPFTWLRLAWMNGSVVTLGYIMFSTMYHWSACPALRYSSSVAASLIRSINTSTCVSSWLIVLFPARVSMTRVVE